MKNGQYKVGTSALAQKIYKELSCDIAVLFERIKIFEREEGNTGYRRIENNDCP